MATEKEKQIVKIICKPDFPFPRFYKIGEALIRRWARRQNKKIKNERK